MGANEFILFLALAAALGVWGLAQLAFSFFDRDKQRLQQRLATEWRADMEALRKRNVTLETEVKGLPPRLARLEVIRRLNRKLVAVYPDGKIKRLLAAIGAGALLGGWPASWFLDSLLAGVAAGLVGGYAPVLFLNAKNARRQRAMADQLPDALDFLCRILRAGHSLSTAIQMMGEELPQPIAAEFRRCYDQHSFGQPLEDALREMAGRVESGDFAFFVTAVLIQRNTGGDLSAVLGNLSSTVRSRIRLHQHVKAITAEGRFTGHILVAFPVVLFVLSYVLNPEYAGVLVKTDVGKTMLGVAVTLQAVGLYAIRRIVNLRA